MTKQLSILAFIILQILCCFGCSKEQTKMVQPVITPDLPVDTTRAKTYKYLALGDSYTIGQSVQAEERFPAQTAQILLNDSVNISDIQYIATTGWTTASLISAINSQNPAHDFDVVTLLIGVNDQYQHMDTAGYRIRFMELLNKAITFAEGKKTHVFVLSIPDYSATPFVAAADKSRVSMEVDLFNAINKEITLQNDIAYIDITPSTRQAASDPSLVATDGLHPSGKEYKKWAEMLAPLVKNALK